MNALQIITLRSPQWATDARINEMIAYVREFTSTEAFGEDTERAIALRVLHIFALEAQRGGNPGASTGNSSGSGQAGMIASETEGQLSRSYSSGSQSLFAYARYGSLSSTVYGQELIELIRANVFSPTTRRGSVDGFLDTFGTTL